MRSDFNYFYDDKCTITMTTHDGFGEGPGILRNNVISIIGASGEEVPSELTIRIAQGGSDAYTRNEFSWDWNQDTYQFLLDNGLDDRVIKKYPIQQVQ